MGKWFVFRLNFDLLSPLPAFCGWFGKGAILLLYLIAFFVVATLLEVPLIIMYG